MRPDGRLFDQFRPITVSYNRYGYADSCVLLELGNTKVLCSVTLQVGVPPFLKGTKTGWLKAEYAMLPSATQVRTQREFCATTRNGRSVEISRLIGRSLRSMMNMSIIGERTVIIDCDVLQADGGTRTACITAASLALAKADEVWLAQGAIHRSAITDPVVAVSIGVMDNKPLLDINFQEDSSVDADFNIVLTHTGSIIELQGTVEKKAISWSVFEEISRLATTASAQLVKLFPIQEPIAPQKVPLFSLENRSRTVS